MQSDVEKILPKLGFSIEDADKLVGNFSGGWQMKVALGKIILQKPDLLLLDEPTNHLDLDSIFWLEEYLSSLKIAIIIISHDRYFLDKLCKKIILVDSSSGEVERPSTKKTGLLGISDVHDNLKFDIVFKNGPKEYISWFIELANERSNFKKK